MKDWCLIRVKWIGRNKQKIMFPFYQLSLQDYRKPKTIVGLMNGNDEIELEFHSLISHFDFEIIEYINDYEPNLDTLIMLADYYKVSFEVYYNNVNGFLVGYGEYNHKKRDMEFMELDEYDFAGCVFKNSVYTYEGVAYHSKYSLRRYIWERKYRTKRINEILQDID